MIMREVVGRKSNWNLDRSKTKPTDSVEPSANTAVTDSDLNAKFLFFLKMIILAVFHGIMFLKRKSLLDPVLLCGQQILI